MNQIEVDKAKSKLHFESIFGFIISFCTINWLMLNYQLNLIFLIPIFLNIRMLHIRIYTRQIKGLNFKI